jgi:Protein of unknown function (DUF3102)
MMRPPNEAQSPDAVARAEAQSNQLARVQSIECCPPRNLSRAPFDYGQLEPTVQQTAREAVSRIKAHGKLAAQSIVAIGAELAKVKTAIGHGNYLTWLAAEFGWSERQAQRFVSVHESFGKSDNLADLGTVDVSALYLLAAPSTPEPVREAALEKAAAGERVTHGAVKALLHEERDQVEHTVKSQSRSFSDATTALLAEELEAEQTGAKPEVEEEENDDTKFVLQHLANTFKLVEYYKGRKPREIAGLIEPARRNGAMRKAKRLGNWLKDLGYWLGQAR